MEGIREEKDKADAIAKMSLVFQKDTKLFAADLGSRKTPVREITDEQLVAVRDPAAAVCSLESVFALLAVLHARLSPEQGDEG